MIGRRYVIEEGGHVGDDQWTVITHPVGEAFSSPTIFAALAVIASDVTQKPGVVALAEHVAEIVAEMERYIIDVQDEQAKACIQITPPNVDPAKVGPSHSEHGSAS